MGTNVGRYSFYTGEQDKICSQGIQSSKKIQTNSYNITSYYHGKPADAHQFPCMFYF